MIDFRHRAMLFMTPPRPVSGVQRKDYDKTLRKSRPSYAVAIGHAGVVSGSPAGLTVAFDVSNTYAGTSGAMISSYA
jgi:hypothetical protein